jgi:alpha-ketoglutarate-dependent taurine dioxygenase
MVSIMEPNDTQPAMRGQPADISVSLVDPERPVVLQVTSESPADIGAWVSTNATWIEQQLCQHGAVLFRGFGVSTPERLERFAAALSNDFPTFAEESSPRHRIHGAVFSSTDYPERYPIQMHNEYSYANEWPMKLLFSCIQPAAKRGGTPVASTRAILRRMRPSTCAAFRERGVMYVRNYRRGVGVSWQKAFGTDNRMEVEQYCARAGLRAEWLGEDSLRTRQIGAAIVRHPRTREEVWFNHGFFFNVHSLEPLELREALLEEGEESLSTQTYFGTGETIPTDIIDELREAYAREKVCFAWQRGDVMIIDNMLTSHGREPYQGPRRIAVAMTERFLRSALQN